VAGTIVDDAFFARVLLLGELGAGEAYMDGLWRSDDLPALLRLFIRNLASMNFDGPLARVGQLGALVRHRLSRNSRRGSEANIHAHYDLGNDFYRLFLDESMTYSCAIFADGDSLEQAQARKLERVCERLGLSAGDHVLEIGCGWGGFALHAARTRGCRVTAVTISDGQHRLAAERVAAAGLSDRVKIVYRDYRDLHGRFDKIVSIEMFEAVGWDYWGAWFATLSRNLVPGGTALVQTITMPDQRFDRYRRRVDWTQKHIFPGSLIPALGAFAASLARHSDLTIIGMDDIGPHYATTLRAWRARFFARLADVRAQGFDERFIRMWDLYLSWSEANFSERAIGDAQILLRKMG
jgi:cyclopropane-fatty-acyl-phospholipid synthase